MADLYLDTEFLTGLGGDLRGVAGEFTNANAHADGVAEAVGHDDLAERVKEFAHNWDDTRKKMVENIETLGKTAQGVGEAFTKLETDLVGALKGAKK